MTTRTHDLSTRSADELAAELDRRRVEQEQQQQADADVWHQEQQQRARAVYTGWEDREAALIADERAAVETYRQAVLDDPLVQAWMSLRYLRYRRLHLRNEAALAQQLLGENPDAIRAHNAATGDNRAPGREIVPLTGYPATLLENLVQWADEHAAERAAADSEHVMRHLQELGDLEHDQDTPGVSDA